MSKREVIDISNIQLNNDIDTRQKIFKSYNSYETCRSVKTCMVENLVGGCEGNIINAHSVSKKNGLSRISSLRESGLELVGKFKKSNTTTLNPLEQEYIEEYVSIESASTFYGLCRKHDNNLFKTIDESKTIKINYTTVYEYTLRNAIYNWYSRMSNRICADKKRKKFNHKVHDRLYYEILSREKVLENEVHYILNNYNNIENRIWYKVDEIDGNLNIAGNFYEYNGETVIYTTLIPDKKKSYILVSGTKDNNILDIDKAINFYTYENKEDLYVSLSELLLQATSINDYFFNHKKWNSLPGKLKEDITNWLYLEDLDKSFNVNARYNIMNIPNFVGAMID